MNAKVESHVTLTFGDTKIELTKGEAVKLMEQLQELVGPKIVMPALPQIERIVIEPPYPFPRPIWPREGDNIPPRRPSWRENEITCREASSTLC